MIRKLSTLSSAAMIAVTLSGCGIAQQAAMQAANQQRTEAFKRAGEESKSATLVCRNRRLSGELKTYVASVQCSNPAILEAYQRASFPYMDLISNLTAKRLEVAEREDRHQITEAQGNLEISEYGSRIVEEERQRNLQNAVVQSHINQAAAQADAANRQASLRMMEMGLNMMSTGNPSGVSSSGGRTMCWNNTMASGTMPNPTICQNIP